MSPLLMAYEKYCHSLRQAAPDLQACLRHCYGQLGRDPGALFAQVNQRIIDLLEADAKQVEHAYHNRHHVCDVVSAIVLLLQQTAEEPNSPASVVDCMITAALGHDLHHDGLGTIAELYVERRSATAVLAIGQEAGLSAADMSFIEALILATYPPVQRELRQKLAVEQGPDQAELFYLMFGEADVLASLTPRFGKVLSVHLSAEWRKAGLVLPFMPDEDAGRAIFLAGYRLVTPSSRQLGVEAMVSDQLRILERKAT